MKWQPKPSTRRQLRKPTPYPIKRNGKIERKKETMEATISLPQKTVALYALKKNGKIGKKVPEVTTSVPLPVPTPMPVPEPQKEDQKPVFRAARKMPINCPRPPTQEESPSPIQKAIVRPKSLPDDNIIRRRSIRESTPPPPLTNGTAKISSTKKDNNLNGMFIRETTPPNASTRPGKMSSSTKLDMLLVMKTPTSSRSKSKFSENRKRDELRTPNRPPPLVEGRTSLRGRKIFRRRTWPWEIPDGNGNPLIRRGVKRKVEMEESQEDDEVKIPGEGEKEEEVKKAPEDYFMGSSLQYLFHHDQSSRLHGLQQRYSEWDDARKETAIRALNYLKTEIPSESGNKRHRDLDNPAMYEVTGRRVTEEGIKYQVEWRNGNRQVNVNEDENDNEDVEYFYFEDYNPHEYFFGRKKKKIKIARETTTTVTSSNSSSIIRASPRIRSQKIKIKRDANNNPIKRNLRSKNISTL